MNLDEHNNKWSEFLASENCPPILGLVPLSENDCQEISKLIERTLAELGEHERYNSVVRRLNYNLLAQLINKYPAVLAVWLARKAGESYEAGAFYEKFEEAIGLHLSLAQRAEFAHRFWRACFVAMRDLPRVIDWGSRPHVEKFLFQAGLPLCHCQTFANMLRAVERQFGLPDPEAPDAVEELRDNLLPRSELTPRPTLKRALLGPAGTFLCQAALRVVLEENFAGINPRLGEELAHSFENCTRDQIRRSARQPFVRLAPDYISLELVGPRQDEDLMACSGLVWIVDGERHRVPAFDEFVSHLATQARVSVELRGLVGGQPLLRTFVLDLQQREQPFMLFDYDTRRLRREGAGAERLWHAKSAQYWLLHPTDATVSSSEQRIEWPDGQRVLSLIRIRPGLEVRLEASDQTYVSFKADQSPFFEPTGEVLLTSGDERIHYGWTRLPAVWLPTEEGDEAQSTGWSLRASAAAQEQTWPLHRDSSMPSEGGMLKCLPHGTEFLLQSPSGLHEVELSVFCGSRPKVSERFLLWIGLSEFRPSDRFILSSSPVNLEQEFCAGFDIIPDCIVHKRDHSPEHILAFALSKGTRFIRWHQAGTFLFSADRKPGQETQWTLHHVGENFAAAVDSSRWLRIRREPAVAMELLVNGAVVHRLEKGGSRSFVDISLAALTTRFPEGGRIAIRWAGFETVVANFTSPLVRSKLKPGTPKRIAPWRFVSLTKLSGQDLESASW